MNCIIFLMFLFLLVLISIFSRATAQQRTSNISLGSSLTPTNTSYWSSASGHFAFGFYPKGDGFAIGIWFAKIQQRTVVWTANRDDPTLSSDVILILSSDGKLILQQNQGQQILIANAAQVSSSASMLDSGNFVLYDSQSKIIWQTFGFPTDTILPGQRLLAGQELVSSSSDTNHTSGRFRLIMQRDGNLVLYPAEYPTVDGYSYWNSGTENAGDNVNLNLDSNGQLYLLNTTGFNIMTLTGGANLSGNPIYRATVDADGIFRLYSHNLDQNGNWSIEWSSSNNKCDPIGLCGLNSYCIVMDQGTSCACPPSFDFIDQSQGNLGCKRNSSVEEDCLSFKWSNFTIHELKNVSWEDSPYSIVSSSTNIACRDECLGDCYCAAAVYSEQECRKQKLPLRFGRIQPSNPVTTFIKQSIGERQREPARNNDSSKNELQIGILITGVTFVSFGFILLAISGSLIFRHRFWGYKTISTEANRGLNWDITLRSFTYQELEIATNGFKETLGRGAFGTVFKGELANGQTTIAVKKLEKVMAEGEVEFQNEMRSIGKTHHKNLVRLLGYCHDKSNIVLVYEYMKNGSLVDFLFQSETKRYWGDRIRIALDIARGIHYLHEECETQIIHCDINPKNILMDENWCAKISDFGLAKLLMPDQSRTITGIRGTRGYVAPEWHKNQPITVKADIYSYGVVFLELICCRRNVSTNVPENEAILVDWVHSCFEENELHRLVSAEEVDEQLLQKMVSIGLWCIQEEPSLRPYMKKVVLMLEGVVEIPIPPTPASFTSAL